MKTKKKNTKIRILQSVRKIAAAVLVVGMNFGGLPAVVGTSAFFSDAEISFGNEFRAGSLDLAVSPASASFLALGGKDSTTNLSGITITNNGTLPLYYDLSVATSTAEVCNELEMSVDGTSGFMGLVGFYFEQSNKLLPGVSDNAMSLTVRMIDPDNFDSYAGQTCNFVLTARARQENLQFGQGFQSSGDIPLSVSLAVPLITAKAEVEPMEMSEEMPKIDFDKEEKQNEKNDKQDDGKKNNSEKQTNDNQDDTQVGKSGDGGKGKDTQNGKGEADVNIKEVDQTTASNNFNSNGAGNDNDANGGDGGNSGEGEGGGASAE